MTMGGVVDFERLKRERDDLVVGPDGPVFLTQMPWEADFPE